MINNLILSIFALSLLFTPLATVYAADKGTSFSFLPEGMQLADKFKPGYGKSVGKTDKVKGQVALSHLKENTGYRPPPNAPLYMNDSIHTGENSRALLSFNDQSTLSVSAETVLEINKSIYDPGTKERSTFINLKKGRTRFLIKKLAGFKRSEFKIKTRNLVAGVRGSDFVIEALPEKSVVSTFEDTWLELVSLAEPDKVIYLNPFQRVEVLLGRSASAIEEITPNEVESLKKEMPITVAKMDVVDSNNLLTNEKAWETSPTSLDDSTLPHPQEEDYPAQSQEVIKDQNLAKESGDNPKVPETMDSIGRQTSQEIYLDDVYMNSKKVDYSEPVFNLSDTTEETLSSKEKIEAPKIKKRLPSSLDKSTEAVMDEIQDLVTQETSEQQIIRLLPLPDMPGRPSD